MSHSLPNTVLAAALAAGVSVAAFQSSALAAETFGVGEGEYALQSIASASYRLSLGSDLTFPIVPRSMQNEQNIFTYDPVSRQVELSLFGPVFCFDLNVDSGTQSTGARLLARDVNDHVVVDVPLASNFSYLPYVAGPDDANLVTVLPVSTGCFGVDSSGSEDTFTLMGVSDSSGEMSLFADRFHPKGGLAISFHDEDGGPFRSVARRGEPGDLTDFDYIIRIENTGTLHLHHAGFQQIEFMNADFHDGLFIPGYGWAICNPVSGSPAGTSCGELSGISQSHLRGEGFSLPPGGAVEIEVHRRIDPQSALGSRIELYTGVVSGEGYERDPVFGAASAEILIADDVTWISVVDPEGDLSDPATVTEHLGEGHTVRVRALDSEFDDEVCPTDISGCSTPLQGVAIAVQSICQVEVEGGCDPMPAELYSHTPGDVRTNEDGIAEFQIASKRAGEIRVTFEVTDSELASANGYGTLAADGLETTADLLFAADEVQRLGFFHQPGDAQISGEPFSTTIGLNDRFDNPATVADGTQVRVSLGRQFEVPDASTDPVLGGTTVRPATGSLVHFDDLTVDLAASGYFLKGKIVGDDQINGDSDLFSVDPNEAVIVRIVTGNGQTGLVNTPVGTSPVVRVTDLNANPVGAGEVVRFQISGGDGSLHAEDDDLIQLDVETDSDSLAQVDVWRLGRTAGDNALNASLPGADGGGEQVLFGATGQPGSPAQLAIGQSPPDSALIGEVVEPSPAVIVQDQYANPLAGNTVRFRPLGDSGFVVEDVIISDEDGLAVVGDWTLGSLVGTQQLEAELINHPVDPWIFEVNAVSGPAAEIAIVPTPLELVAGECEALSVTVTDSGGNPAGNVTVTAAFEAPDQADPMTACQSSADTDSSGQAVLQLGARSAGTWDVLFSFGDEQQLEVDYAIIAAGTIDTIVFLVDLPEGLTLQVGDDMPATVLGLIDEFGNLVEIDDGLTELQVMDDDVVVGDYADFGPLPAFVQGIADLDDLVVLDAAGADRQLRAAYSFEDENESTVTLRTRSQAFDIDDTNGVP